jgi:RING-type zinc-finger
MKRKHDMQSSIIDDLIENLGEKKVNREETETKGETIKEYECPICSDYMVIPAKLNCGHYFCKECIIEWIDRNRRLVPCPICRTTIKGGKGSVKVDQDMQNHMKDAIRGNGLKKRIKKAKTRENYLNFFKKYKKSERFDSLCDNIQHLLDESGGYMTYDNLILFLPGMSDDDEPFKKSEIDFYLWKKSIDGCDILLIDDKIIDINSDEVVFDEHSDIVNYLKENPKELFYAYIKGVIDDDLIKIFDNPQSSFFKDLHIHDKEKNMKRLWKNMRFIL